MYLKKISNKKRSPLNATAASSLESSLTSIEWLPNMQIGENASSTSITPIETQQTFPITTNGQQKSEPRDMDMSKPLTTNTTDAGHMKPPYSYVTLIRQAILSAQSQRMTLNEIYHWIIESYPYFRTAPPKWKNSIRHNLSLNKCFKRLQRHANDPGKGSYWAVDESYDNNHQLNTRRRKFEEKESSLNIIPSSPMGACQQSQNFYTNNNPMICGDIGSVGGQSSSTDESDSTPPLAVNVPLPQWDDGKFDLTESFRRFRTQVLDVPNCIWPTAFDAAPMNTASSNNWTHDIFPNGEANFFESIKLASSGRINWNEIDVKPYFEFLDDFRSSSTFQPQDRDKFINLASSLSSFFDHTGISSLAQSKIINDPLLNQPLNTSDEIVFESLNHNALPIVTEDEPTFDWDSITG